MPNIKRLYIITDALKLDQAETDAEAVDIAGIGTGSFADGTRLTDDERHIVTYFAIDLQKITKV